MRTAFYSWRDWRAPAIQFPRERKTADGRRVIVHAPQIRSWNKFEKLSGQVAVEFPDETKGARYAAIDTRAPQAEREGRMPKGIESKPIVVPVGSFPFYFASDEGRAGVEAWAQGRARAETPGGGRS